MCDKIKEWAKAAAVRAAKSAAQAGIMLMGTDMVSITQLDWTGILGCMLTMAVLSMLTSVAGIPEVEDGASVRALHASNE